MEPKTIITTVATSLSILGCIVIFLAHKVWVDIRSNSRKILVYITIADLFTALGYLFGLQSHWKGACVFQSFVTTASSMTSFFWTTCMALYLYSVSIKVNTELGRRIICLFHCIAWAVPLLITLVALLAGKLGKSCVGTARWCWIKEDHCFGNLTSSKPKFESIMWMLVTGKFWEILSYIFILAVYARIFIYVRQQRKMVEDQSNPTTVARFRAVENRTILIPKFFIFIRIWGTLEFLVYAFSSDGRGTVEFLEYLQAFGDGAQGFVNAILFCAMTDKWKSFLQRCFSRERGEREGLLNGNEATHRSNPI